jgi:mevalonate pyrophosphate decarboxylase
MLPMLAAFCQTRLLFHSVCRNVKDENFAYNDTTRRIITSVKEIKPLERGEIVFLMTIDSVPNHV